ncbi:MAG: D-alanine--D-alanine ligase [Desulfobacterales bacterium]|jgi:D-alanine-D-alanine ligase|nr:D-alanine--D-alanine ligase [Desulfobacterales bacterium]
MKISIIHDIVGDADSLDAKDVLYQAASVKEALEVLGHEVAQISCGLDLEKLRGQLLESKTEMVFNLMESMEGQGRLIHLVPFCLDAWKIPYTGNTAEAMMITSNKVMAKRCMEAVGLPTAPWIGPYPHRIRPNSASPEDKAESLWIIKSVWEHASIGVHQKGLVTATEKELLPLLKEHAQFLNGDCFAEKFIDGREFNLSVLGGLNGPEVLPAAEILFEGFAPEKPRIVCYNAKWVEDSFEYQNTPRDFKLTKKDGPLVKTLIDLARRCWKEFALSGYARIDLRVDHKGQPWILEINANPCINPDGGFAAAAIQGDITYAEVIERILLDARGGRL